MVPGCQLRAASPGARPREPARPGDGQGAVSVAETRLRASHADPRAGASALLLPAHDALKPTFKVEKSAKRGNGPPKAVVSG